MSYLSFFLDYPYSAEWVAVIRVLSCGFLLFAFTFLIRDAWNFLKPDGVFGVAEYMVFCKKFPQLSLFNLFPHSRRIHYFVVVFFYASGLFAMLGLFTQYSLFVFFVCVISLQSRLAPLVFTAADAVVRSLLLCLLLTDCGSALSLDVLWDITAPKEFVDGWAMRVFQVFICMVYAGAAMPKLFDRFWLSGVAVRNAVLSHMWGKRFLRRWISENTRLLTIACLVYEYLAPVFLMMRETAIPAVVVGIFFHMGVAIFLRVGCFGPVMCISLLAFINPGNGFRALF